MFGHHDDDQSAPPADETKQGVTDSETADTDRPSGEAIHPDTGPDLAAATPPPPVSPNWQHPGKPLGDSATDQPGLQAETDNQLADSDQIADVISPAGGFPKRPTFSSQADAPTSDETLDTLKLKSDASSGSGDKDQDLLEIRRKALLELAPVIEQLDLPPEEKFRTIMMIIQINDDKALVKAAYEAAHGITDEKDKAQALVDIVNEVNYFTHQPGAEQPEN